MFDKRLKPAFLELSSGVIVSREGYIVNTHGHFELLYLEGNHVAKFCKEPGSQTYIYYMKGEVRWEAPYSDEKIELSYQNLIKDRCVAVLKFRGYKVTIYR